MTQISGHAAAARSQSGDGQALKRRLLQDLERQWLDDWGRADQIGSSVASPRALPDPSANASACDTGHGERGSSSAFSATSVRSPLTHALQVMAGSHALPGAQPAPLVATEAGFGFGNAASPPGVASRAPVPAARAISAGPFTVRVDESQAAPGLCKRPVAGAIQDWDAMGPMAHQMAGEVQAPRGPAGEITRSPSAIRGDAALATWRGGLDPASSGAMARGGAGGGLAATLVQAPDTPSLEAQAWSASGSPLEDQGRFAQLVRAQSSPVGAGHVSIPTQPADAPSCAAPALRASSSQAEPDGPAAKFSRQQPPLGRSMHDAGLHRLMLRELNDQAVLASMRDARLDAHASEWAAQGLAMALMEAGYARVQVVVNGHTQLRTASAPKDWAARDAIRHLNADDATSSHTQTVEHHGYPR